MLPVKICGLTSLEAVQAAVAGGAGYLGWVFHPPSPRAVTPAQAAALVQAAADRAIVGVFVDPDDAALEAVLSTVPLSMLQLHGRETPQRTAQIGARFGLPVIKALSIDRLERADAYTDAAMLLIDAPQPGGGVAYDVTPLRSKRFAQPWFLAGGLRAETLAQAAAASGARMFDVSSGVESAPGVKDPAAVTAFLAAARALLT